MIRSYMAESERSKQRTSIVINEDWCKACGICVEFCPKGIIRSAERTGKPVITDASLCIRCKLCEIRCPDFAISVGIEGEDGEDS